MRLSPLLGSGLVAAVAYVDPGNIVSNMTAAERTGYRLVWVVVAANLFGAVAQYLSAKLGVVTGRDLAQLCHDQLRPWLRFPIWILAELGCIATEIAELVGFAIALRLLVGLPLPAGSALGSLCGIVLVARYRRHRSQYTVVLVGLLALVMLAFVVQLLALPPPPVQVLRGLRPQLAQRSDAVLAAAIVGATIMPHALFLHSGLTRSDARRNRNVAHRLRQQRREVTGAMTLAGLVNVIMLVVGAVALDRTSDGHPALSLDSVHGLLQHVAGSRVAAVFVIALLASGLAATVVGGHAGQLIMQGFLGRSVPFWIRQLVTMAPTTVALLLGWSPTRLIILSQAALTPIIPVVLILLLRFGTDCSIMGEHRNHLALTVVAAAGSTVICALTLALVVLPV